jgi:hypothetical protein
MTLRAYSLRYPVDRALLRRTRLAYVHLRNLLTDAKRDRTARVYAYVIVWLPEELLMLFLQEGEVVNASATADGQRFRTLPISEAVAKVPNAAEFGEICFHTADDEQLATMFWTQTQQALPWPAELTLHDADAVRAYLHASMHDGVVEVVTDVGVNYLMLRQGELTRGYFADRAEGTPDQRLRGLLDPSRKAIVRLWPVPPPLPVQAPPALIQAYRELMAATVKRLVESGTDGAPAVAEQARHILTERHPVLERFSLQHPNPRDPVAGTPELSTAIGAWLGELLWAAAPGDGTAPEQLMADLTRDRRHVFQSAGLYDALPWKVER